MKCSNRLEAIVQSAARSCGGGTAADIGTDHGFVPIRLLETGGASRVIAADVRPGPLSRAAEHAAARGLLDKIELRLGDGLSVLSPGEAQTVVIAGMGGGLMLSLLRKEEAVRKSVSRFILSPQSELALFRRSLPELGLSILDEALVEEGGKFYFVITAGQGKETYARDYEYAYGGILFERRDPLLEMLLRRDLERIARVRASLIPADTEAKRGRLAEVEREYALLKEACHAFAGSNQKA